MFILDARLSEALGGDRESAPQGVAAGRERARRKARPQGAAAGGGRGEESMAAKVAQGWQQVQAAGAQTG